MREINAFKITETVKELCLKALIEIRPDILDALKIALESETEDNPKLILKTLIENASYAREEGIATCQDTGYIEVFFKWGQEAQLTGSSLGQAVNEGVKQAYKEGYFRKSIVDDPVFERKDTTDNTPALTDVTLVEGDKVEITVFAKGAGSDNASELFMLKPTVSKEQITDKVIDVAKRRGPFSCPPLIVGVGIGASFDSVAGLSKKALLRKIGERNKKNNYSVLELQILKKLNATGIGPAGFGGKTTALDVLIEERPTHMASMPLAVNIGCWAIRSASVVI